MTGVIEGHPLSQFIPGFIYEIDHFTGAQLIELNAAIEVRSTDDALATTGDDSVVDVERVTGGVLVVPPDTAEDRPERRRRKPRGK